MKFTPKELKKPDKFREYIADAIIFASKNYLKIIAVFGVIVVILVVIFILNVFLQKSQIKANSEFAEAVKSYTGEDSAQNSQEALDKFMDIKEKYPRTDVSKIALYYAADINYNMGKYDEAIRLLNDFTKSGVKDQTVIDAAYLTLGKANFKKGNWQGAIDYLSKIDKEGNPYRNEAKLYTALSFEKLGKFGESEKIYNQLFSRNSTNSLKLGAQ